MPPHGSSFQSILKSAISMLPKTVSIAKDSPTRFSPEQPRMSDESDSAMTEFYPDQDTGKAPKQSPNTESVPSLPEMSSGSRGRLTIPSRSSKGSRAGSGSRRSSASRGTIGSRSSVASSRRTRCQMKNGLCESYSNDRCGKCRAHLRSGCSKVCPISCNVSPLCENCEDPEKHQCFVLVIQKMQSQSQEHLAAILAQHEQATRMADARLQTMEQMVRDARRS